jgi:hypothetical protein
LFIIIYLTPCVPLSYQGEGEIFGRGATPLLNAPFYIRWVVLLLNAHFIKELITG